MPSIKKQTKKRPLEVAFDMGQKAFYRGIFNSPYKVTSFLHKEWTRGFNSGFFYNQEKLLKETP